MALIHDLGESIIGDITPHCGVDMDKKKQMETEAMKTLTGLLPQDAAKGILS